MKPNLLLKNRPVIYGIRNLINGKIYIGRTKCMYKRCHQYLYDFEFRALGHLNDYLYRAMVKDGIDNFEMVPLEFCSLDVISERELYWMKKSGSTDRQFGYNLRMDSSTGMVTSPETSLKMSENLKRQWAAGIRDGHSEKLKKKWASDPERVRIQGELFSHLKTKYEYEVHHPTGEVEFCKYNRLLELRIGSVLSTYHRRSVSDAVCKGFRVIRRDKCTSSA
jgi:group I intron endonuclease